MMTSLPATAAGRSDADPDLGRQPAAREVAAVLPLGGDLGQQRPGPAPTAAWRGPPSATAAARAVPQAPAPRTAMFIAAAYVAFPAVLTSADGCSRPAQATDPDLPLLERIDPPELGAPPSGSRPARPAPAAAGSAGG